MEIFSAKHLVQDGRNTNFLTHFPIHANIVQLSQIIIFLLRIIFKPLPEGDLNMANEQKITRKLRAILSADEILADLDWLPTIAHLIGEEARVPRDRPIDGVNQAEFILGKQGNSNREYVVAYVGDTVFAVKWRNMKVHFATAEGTHAYIHTYTFPQVFDIKEDPKESFELWGNEGYAHAWVMGPITQILGGLNASMQKYPNIRPGQDFIGYK